MTNEELYEKAMEAISELFGDTSVSQSETKERLEELRDEINIMIENLGDE